MISLFQANRLIQAYHDLGQFNGTALVAENGKVIYQKGFGMANIEWNIPNRATGYDRTFDGYANSPSLKPMLNPWNSILKAPMPSKS